ncbi:CdaR family transcriptional regulator [Gudongella sp. DL1XJH-153]|uniref:CdaR family transcriptional regulator n=1 Tax=Gudongella sp. DL1XJH-153 TaxID=3409804 RepID=UPI003BB568FC
MKKLNINNWNKYLQSIIVDIKDLTNQDTIFMDLEGRIIASKDSNRIGTVHHGALEVIRTDEEIIIKSDDQYSGARKGFNFPIKVEGEIIGVVGITGENEEILKSVRIVSRMIEIFIKEIYLMDIEKHSINKDKMLIESLLFSGDFLPLSRLVNEVNVLDLKNRKPKRIIASTVEDKDDKYYELKEEIFKIYRDSVKSTNTVVSIFGDYFISIIDDRSISSIQRLLKRTKKKIFMKTGHVVISGVGKLKSEIYDAKNSYSEAIEALKWGIAESKDDIIFYSDLDIEILLSRVPVDSMNEYVNKIIGDMEYDDIVEYTSLIDLYTTHKGSIIKMAEDLYIHKNTVQYKLNRLTKLTNLDMRNSEDYMKLRLALILKNLKM